MSFRVFFLRAFLCIAFVDSEIGAETEDAAALVVLGANGEVMEETAEGDDGCRRTRNEGADMVCSN